MTLLTFSLFSAGLATALIPVLIHLLMRSKPKKVELPTVRFVLPRFVSNRRRFVLRNILLLLLRAGLLVLLGLLLARPSLQLTNSKGKIAGFQAGADHSASAVALVIDTSVRMGYLYNNEIRLDTAKEFAADIIARLSGESRVAVLNATSDNDSFQVDLSAAKEKVGQLEITPGGRPVADSVLKALTILQESDLPVKELFVLTDGTRPGWPSSFAERFRQEKKKLKIDDGDISCYFVNVGQKDWQNTSLSQWTLPAETGTVNTPFRFEVTLTHQGKKKSDVVEFHLLDPAAEADIKPTNITKTEIKPSKEAPQDAANTSPPPTASTNQKPGPIPGDEKLFEQSVEFPEGSSVRTAVFTFVPKSPGIQLGYFRLVADDSLQTDNIRWFALNVQENWKVLLVSEEPIRDNTLFVREALAPFEYRKDGRAPFETVLLGRKELEKKSLKELRDYRAILLLDPGPLTQSCLKILTDYVQQGGGLGFFPGKNARPVSAFQTPEALELFGGRLAQQIRVPDWNVRMKPVDESSSILAGFRRLNGEEVPWNGMTVGRFWQVTDLAESVSVPIRWSDEEEPPALFTHRIGQGTVIVGTTPFSEVSQTSPWNHFVTGETSWVWLVLMDGIARTLVSGESSVFNFYPKETVLARPGIKSLPDSAVLILPNNERILIPVDVAGRQIRFAGTNQIGLYRLLTSPNADGEVINGGFAVNYPTDQFDLTPVPEKEMENLWKGTDFHLINNINEVQMARSRSRTGRELYAIVLLLFGLLLAGESVLANRFYK